jgi:hypothetical protein
MYMEAHPFTVCYLCVTSACLCTLQRVTHALMALQERSVHGARAPAGKAAMAKAMSY